jgi:outer membrane protein assembly factor BamB
MNSNPNPGNSHKEKSMNVFLGTVPVAMLAILALALTTGAAEPAALPADAVPAQGLVVVVAPEDPELPVALAGPDRLVVVFAREGSAVRRAARAKGVAGLVQVIELPALDVLPLADRLAALTVGRGDVPPVAELKRVTRPLGRVARWQDGAWRIEAVPWPAGMMQWPDAHGGPSAEPYRGRDVFLTWPMAPRWADGPAIGMAPVGHDSACIVSAGGRLVVATCLDDANLSAPRSRSYVRSWWLVARDAFSGMRLWRRPLGYDPLPSRQREVSRHQPLRSVAMDETRVFTWGEKGLLVVEAATGKEMRQLETVRSPAVNGRIFLAGGRVLAQVEGGWQAFDLKTLTSVWDVKVDTLGAMADDRTLAVVGPERITAVDVATGAVRWQCEHPRPTSSKFGGNYTNVGIDYVDADIVVVWLGSERWILGAADGTKRWTLGKPGSSGAPAVVARHGDVIQIGPSVCRVADGQSARDRQPQPIGGGNCTMPLLLETFAINGKGTMIRLPGSKEKLFYPALRTPCNGYAPAANGLVYAVGSTCGCVPLFVRGTAAHGAARIVDPEALAARPRPVERGPGRPAAEGATGWTMYRADLRRSAATAAEIGGVPRISWTARLEDPLPDGTVAQSRRADALHGPSAPTVAGDAICVVDRDRHSLVCLDAVNGKVRWRKDLPVVVDTPPTLAGGCALFGAHDGWVYCLSLADGALVWRARAAPADDWWMAYGRLASRWPVIGSVVVEGDTVLATAGWTVGRDGGIFAATFGLADGATRWAKVLPKSQSRTAPCFNDAAIADARGVPVVVGQCLRAEPEEGAALLDTPQEGLVRHDPRGNGRYDMVVHGVRGLALAFADDLVLSANAVGMSAFAADAQPRQPPRWQTPFAKAGSAQVVALAGDVAVAALGQADGTGRLIVCNRTDGAAMASLPLPAPPVRDGLAIVKGAIVAVCADGSVVLMRSP